MLHQSEKRVSITARIDSLSCSGPAIAMWEAILRRDREGGSAVMCCLGANGMVASAAPLAVALLNEAGAEQAAHHERLFAQPEPCGNSDIPGNGTCAVVSACLTLAPIVKGTVALDLLGQVAVAFLADPSRTVLTLERTTVIEVAILINAAALLVAKRRNMTVPEVLEDMRTRVLAAA